MKLQEITAPEFERLFRQVFAESALAMALVGPDYRFEAVNSKFCELLGYTATELSEMTFLDVTHPEEINRDRRAAVSLFEGESCSYQVRKRYLRKDGTSIWMELHTTLIRDDAGAPRFFFSMVDDSSRRSLSEQERRRAAQESCDRMVDILEATPDFVAILDIEGRMSYLNSAGRRMTGHDADGRTSMADCYPAWAWQRIAENGFPQATQHGHWFGETALLDGHGGEVPMSQVILAHRDQAGNLTGFSTVARDISGLKQAHASLQRRLRQQAIVTDLGGLALSGGSVDELMQRACAGIAEGLDVELSEVLESRLEGGGLWLRVGIGWRSDYLGCAAICPDGDCPPAYAMRSGEPVVVTDLRTDPRFRGRRLADEHGVVSGISVIITGPERPFGVLAAYAQTMRRFTRDDITFVQAVANILSEALLRQHAERSLRESDARFRAFMENSNALAFIRDAGGLHMFGNRPWADEFGTSLEGLLARRVDVESTPVDSHVEETFEAGAGPDGRRRYWRVIQFPVNGAPGETSIGGFVLDVTERQEMRSKLSQAERLAAVGELAAGVAHEVNNPLGTMINCAQLLKDGENDPSLLDDIICEGERIAGIVRNLLDFAREGPSEPRPTDLRLVIKRTLALVATGFRAHGVRLEQNTDGELPTVLGNPQKLQQVFLNILVNAKDALLEARHDKDNKTISVFCDQVMVHGRPVARLRFRDNGPGLVAELEGRIFDPFVTSKRARGGTGLGLSISKSIVEEHNGALEVTSEAGEFTEFTVTLPGVSEDS